jgi:hypothetical protein
MGACLTLIETSGNQAYIYATNRLRDNIGASELTWRCGLRWVLEAAGANAATAPGAMRNALLRAPQVAPGVEVVVAASGKAILVCDDSERARGIVAAVTERAAREAPGLSVCGASVGLADRADPASVSRAMRELHQRFNQVRDALAGAAMRASLLPFVEPCASSGLPAAVHDGEPLSAMTRAKKAAAGDWFQRAASLLPPASDGARLRLARSADELERRFASDWLGVVHADGNGLGRILLQFDRWLQPGDDYLEVLRRFSLELDAATEAAFADACRQLAPLAPLVAAGRRSDSDVLPLVPLVLGGDDLTVLIDGRLALPFARAFLLAFEQRSGEQPTLARIARQALGAAWLSCCAGVAIVKPHFPFHAAYGLSEQLLRSAKAVKSRVQHEGRPWPCSALDFHVLFDAAASDLNVIRHQRRTADDDALLWGGPYVVTPSASTAGAERAGQVWAASRHFDALLRRIAALAATDGEQRRRLPSSQTHALREGLAAGRAASDAQLRALLRFEDHGLRELYEEAVQGGPTLFAAEGQQVYTRFLDALTALDFWPAQRSAPGESVRIFLRGSMFGMQLACLPA